MEPTRRAFSLYLLASSLSMLGDMAALTALSVHVFTESGSGAAVGGLFAARMAPRLFGAFFGAVADRFDLRSILIFSYVGSGGLFLAMALLAPSYAGLLVMVVVAETFAGLSQGTAGAMVPRLLPEEKRARANGAMMVAIGICFGLGSALGGITMQLWGYRWALTANAFSFFIAFLLIALLTKVPAVHSGERGFVVRQGARHLIEDRQLAVVSLGLVGVTFAAAIDRPAMVRLTQHELDGGGIGYGAALGAIGVGAMLAALAIGRARWLTPTTRLFLMGISAQAIGHLLIGLSPWIWLIAVIGLGVGFGNGLEAVSGTTIVQKVAPLARVGVIGGTIASFSTLADAFGSMIGGPLVDLIGPRPVFAISAAIMTTILLAGSGHSMIMKDRPCYSTDDPS